MKLINIKNELPPLGELFLAYKYPPYDKDEHPDVLATPLTIDCFYLSKDEEIKSELKDITHWSEMPTH